MVVRYTFYVLLVLSSFLTLLVAYFWPPALDALWIIVPLGLLGLYDICLSKHNILYNYPVIGHLRYFFEFVRPEIQQYFVATNLSGRPFNREERSVVYQRAQNERDTHPFGTEHDISESGYVYAQHSLQPQEIAAEDHRFRIGGKDCRQPYSASRLNISAMSYGALSRNAIRALNLGAKQAKMFHNTGEGGLTDHHLSGGGDIVWQIGTGYFGCRTPDGQFDPGVFAEKARNDVVKMIEIKLSQGAKPSHGGLLPKEKITEEISHIRGIPMGKDCLSPATHQEFSTPKGLLEFVVKLRELSGGKPVGFKLAIGSRVEFMAIVKAMLNTGIVPDFITVDGAEGGTGAAPLEFTNRLGTPSDEALAFVHSCLVGTNLRGRLRLLVSGKVCSAFTIAKKVALGADGVNAARSFMFSLGCIQALRCNENNCPTGVTSNVPARYRAIDIKRKAEHVANFHRNTLYAFKELAGAMGVKQYSDLSPSMIYYRISSGESVTYADLFHMIAPGALLGNEIPEAYAKDWQQASGDTF
jgi:glutamate synthase domain-containing protein 2